MWVSGSKVDPTASFLSSSGDADCLDPGTQLGNHCHSLKRIMAHGARQVNVTGELGAEGH